MDWGSIAAGLGGAALGAFSGGGGQTQSSRGDSVSTSAGQTASNTTSTANTSGTSTQNSTNTTSGTSTSGPLSWQLPFLQQGMQTAQGLYQDASQMGAYEGDLYAGLNDAQRGTLDQVLGYVRGQGGTLNQGTIDAARTALQAGSGAADTLNQIAGSAGVGAVASDADVFANSGLGQRVQAAGGASSFDNVMDQARAYADEVTPGLVQAATRDDVRRVTEGQLPQIDRNAAATGNINSTRTAIESGIARRGLEDRIADTSAQIRTNALQRGAAQASQSAAQQAGIYGDLLGQGTNAALQGRNIQLGTAGQQSNLMGRGLQGAQAGNQMTLGNLQSALAAGGVLQSDAQAQLDAARQQFEMQRDTPMSLFGQYWPIISSNLGRQTTTDMTNTGTQTGRTSETAETEQSQTGVSSNVSTNRSNQRASNGGADLASRIFGGALSGLGAWNGL